MNTLNTAGELLFKLAQIGFLVSTLWILATLALSFMYHNSTQEEVDRINGIYRSFSLIIPIIILFMSTIIFIIY